MDSDEEFERVAKRRHEALRRSAEELYRKVAGEVIGRSIDDLEKPTTPTSGS